MFKSQRSVQWITALAPLVFATLAFYHGFKAIPIGAGYVVATHAFQAIFYMLVAIFVLVGTHRDRDR